MSLFDEAAESLGAPEPAVPDVAVPEPDPDACSWCNSTHLDDEGKPCFMCRPHERPDLDPATGLPPEPPMPPWLVESPHFPADAENVRRLGLAFFGRKNPTPIRRHDTWKAEKRTVTMEDFALHLKGTWALGAYLLDDADMSGAVVADIDCKDEIKELVLAGDREAILDLACWARVVGAEMSRVFAAPMHVTLTGGKGAHVIHVLPERAPAAILRRQMAWMCFDLGLHRDGLEWKVSTGDIAVDTFPRQDATDGGLGNLIRLPNGVDPSTDRRALVVVDDPTRMQAHVCEPLYRVDPADARERSRREIQQIIDTGRQLDWVEGYLGNKYEHGLRERCQALIDHGHAQMRSAVGQVIHQFGWGTGSWEPMTCRGLLADLEELAAQ